MRPIGTSLLSASLAFILALCCFDPALAQTKKKARTPAPVSTPVPAVVDKQPALRAAGTFVMFQDDITALENNPIKTGRQLDRALDTMAGHSSVNLTKGFIAFGAFNAAQNPELAAALNKIRKAYGDERLFAALKTDLNYVSRLPGAKASVEAALNAALKEGARTISAGEKLEQQAYSLQKSPMRAERAPAASARISQLKAAAITGRPVANSFLVAMAPPATGAEGSVAPTLMQQVAQALKIGADSGNQASASGKAALKINPARRATIDRMVTLAAYQVLDAGETHSKEIDELLVDPKTRDCIEWSRLQLNQCVSATRFKYEHAYCLGKHAMKDVGTCLKASVQ